ncbi:MAG: AbrB/MazE/SpoVT family DNA-binding domain-containing protein [Cytophagales bacterium]|nr:AbrB/MazE/SpoVT family DNA-binding domain-containing protein [Cytophagales bacterium]
MTTATLSSKFQFSIPKKLRQSMNLAAGQKFVFLRIGDSIKMVPEPSIDELFGLLPGADTSGYRDRSDRRDKVLAA